VDFSVFKDVVVPLVSALIGAGGAWLAAVLAFKSEKVANKIAAAGVLLTAQVSQETLDQAQREGVDATMRNATNLLAAVETERTGYITLQSLIRSGRLEPDQLDLARDLVRSVLGPQRPPLGPPA